MIFPTFRSNILRSAVATVLILGASTLPGRSEAVADFSGGLGEGAPNQFPGMGGQGWTAGWQTAYWRDVKDGFSFDVKKDADFKDGAAVLQVLRGGDEGFVRLTRVLDQAAINLASAHTVEFQIRVDEFTGSPENPFLFTIGGTSDGSKNVGPLNTAWCLVISDRNSIWGIYQSNGSGGLSLHQTNVRLETGMVYSITVRLFPEERMFQVTIDSGAQVYESPRLLSANPEARSEALSFGGWVARSGTGSFRWSLGPVRVQAANRTSKP